MPQGVLPFKYEAEKSQSGMTAFAGLPAYLDFAHAIGIRQSIERSVQARTGDQGWTDSQVITSLILLNLAGGDSVEDIKLLEADEGVYRILRHTEWTRKSRSERKKLEKRFRKERKHALPSPSSIFRYLSNFHDEKQEKLRHAKGSPQAFIPAPTEYLKGLYCINKDLLSFYQRRSPQVTATIDGDATIVVSHKETALHSYKGEKSYQPLNMFWAETDLLIHSEFRDGNVPAGHQQLRVFQETLDMLPEGVEKVYHRSDTAGYQWELLKYMAEGKNERFGVIEFAVGVDVTPSFKRAVAQVSESEWKSLYRSENGTRKETGQEWAEVVFVPNALSSKKGPDYRFIAIREALPEQTEINRVPQAVQEELPFPTMKMEKNTNGLRYKIFGVVTNRDLPGEELINWHRKRCGKSEEVHAVMKDDLACGRLPSKYFGVNAAWWAIMILAYNLNIMMKRLVLGGEWVSKRMKALRFSFINVAGRVVERSRSFFIRLKASHPALKLLLRAREKILELAQAPAGFA